MTKALFRLGQVVATPGALELMAEQGIDASELLRRHMTGDWGDIHPEDRGLNEKAVETGSRILSVYGPEEKRVWIITEADRSSTCILKPDEY